MLILRRIDILPKLIRRLPELFFEGLGFGGFYLGHGGLIVLGIMS